MKILAIVPYDIAKMGYLQSQVVNPFSFLVSVGADITLLSIGDTEDQRTKTFSHEIEKRQLKGVFVKPSRIHPFNYLKCLARARKEVRARKYNTVFAREVWGGVAALAAKMADPSVNMVYDFRGAGPEETLFKDSGLKGHAKSLLLEFLERVMTRKADRLNAVTNRLSFHLLKKYGRGADTVIPCCSVTTKCSDEADIKSVRTSLGFSDDNKVYVYSGRLSKWQMFEETARLFSKISAKDPTARFLVLTPDPERACEALTPLLKTGTYLVMSVKQDDVATFLAAGDIGFLLREDNIVNNVAFPIKFAEYVSAGLAIITTEGVAEVADMMRSCEYAQIIDPLAPDENSIINWSAEIMRQRNKYRENAINYAKNRLLWSSYVDVFTKLYG